MSSLAIALSLLAAAAPTAPPPSIDSSLSGEWVFALTADAPEPPPGAVRLPTRCWEGGATLHLKQRGAKIEGHIEYARRGGGARPMFTVDQSETIHGSARAGRLVLFGEHQELYRPETPGALLPPDVHSKVNYALHYDARTRHLVGTLDGQPFWAARVQWQKHGPCGDPPP